MVASGSFYGYVFVSSSRDVSVSEAEARAYDSLSSCQPVSWLPSYVCPVQCVRY